MKIIVSNWKSYFSYNTAVVWAKNYAYELEELALQTQYHLILCPSFEALADVAHTFKNKPIAIGAQNCCAFAQGPYTGQVLAESLAQLGCTYCIIGHHEVRSLCDESPELLLAKITQLAAHTITPIICVGESHHDYLANKTVEVLTNQLRHLLQELRANNPQKLIIAYEPLWSIGSGEIADTTYLEKTFDTIRHLLATCNPELEYKLLYGGSVNPDNINQLDTLSCDGFLIGSASTDFQALKKIVLYQQKNKS